MTDASRLRALPRGALPALTAVAAATSAVAPVTDDMSCFEDAEDCGDRPCFTFSMCCNQAFGKEGNVRCWDGARYTYRSCCVFQPGDASHKYLPQLDHEAIHVALSPRLPGGGQLLRMQQDVSNGNWSEQVSGLLWKSGYAMFRWLEELPDATFKGRSTLELGAGIGLLSLLCALRGAMVTATDGHARAVKVARSNAEANLPPEVFWNRLTWRLVRWEDAQSPLDAWEVAGLRPPYELVVCSALLYAPLPALRQLVRLMWVCTDDDSVVLWSSGNVHTEQYDERWGIVAQCFEVAEEVDTTARGFEGDLRRLRRRRGQSC